MFSDLSSHLRLFRSVAHKLAPIRFLFWGLVVLSFLFEGINLLKPWIFKEFFDALDQNTVTNKPFFWVLLFVVSEGLLWGLEQARIYLYQHRIETAWKGTLYREMFSKLLTQPYRFFQDVQTGSLLHKLRQHVHAHVAILDYLFWDIFPFVIGLTGAFAAILFKSYVLGLILMGWTIVFAAFNIYLARKRVPLDDAANEKGAEVDGFWSDVAQQVVSVQAMDQTDRETKRFYQLSKRFETLNLKSLNAWQRGSAFNSGAIVVIEGILYALVVPLWRSGALTIGDVVFLQVYLLSLINRTAHIGRVIRRLEEAASQAKAGFEVFLPTSEAQGSRKRLPTTQGEIRFHNVRFGYTSQQNVLHNVSFSVQAGERVALVGPSGSGKSTIFKLLLGFLTPSEGEITINGLSTQVIDLSTLRRQISWVPQDPALFHRSIAENITYGRPTASKAEMIKAARAAYAHEFISHLPEGYDSMVGERGIKLSGGERQRIAIARAIVRNTPILLFDEATSALDSSSEAAIQKALTSVMKGKTTLMIAHRLSTVLHADRIIVLKAGHVVEVGTHTELIAKEHGVYRTMWDLQSGGFLGEKEP